MKMVVTLSRIPFPLEKGDKLRAYHQIKSLIEAGHDVHIACFHFEKAMPENISALEKLGGHWYWISLAKAAVPIGILKGIWSHHPWQVLLFHQQHAQKKFSEIIKEIQPEVLYSQMIRTAEYTKHFHDIPKILDYMDALSLGLQKRKDKAPWYTKWFWSDEWERVKKYESIIAHYFDALTIISQKDANGIVLPEGKKINVISNGIDFDFFSPNNISGNNAVLFTGNMNYPPNIDAALRLGMQIMPLVWKEKPDVKLIIAGAEPNKVLIQTLTDQRILITGWMDDIRNAYQQGKVFAAPMTMGSGMQNKILEALSMGLPVVCSDLAADAFELDLKKELAVAHDDLEFAQAILQHLNSESANPSDTARQIIQSQFSWKKVTEPLLLLLQSSTQ